MEDNPPAQRSDPSSLRHDGPKNPQTVSLIEFDDALCEIDGLRETLETISSSVGPGAVDRTLDDLRQRVAVLIADCLVPLAIKAFDLPPIVALERIIAASIQRMDLREFPNGFEIHDRASIGRPNTTHDRELAFAAVAAFSKTRFPESIALTRRGSDCIIVQTTVA